MQDILSLCHICKYNPLQQHSAAAKQDFMYTLRRILRSNRLAFISDKPNTMIRKHLCRFLCHRSFPGNQNTLIRVLIMGFAQYGSRVLPGDKAIVS